MPAAYPIDTDLQKFLRPWTNVLDASDIADLDFAGSVAVAITQWEQETHYIPFLQTSDTPTTRLFTPPGPMRGEVDDFNGRGVFGGGDKLFLPDCGVLSLSSLTVGVTDISAGTLLTPNIDYRLLPEDAPNIGRPYTQIRFRHIQRGEWESIVAVGVFGYCTTLPQDVWNVIIRDAAMLLTPSFSFLLTGSTTSWSLGTAKEQMAANPLAATVTSWQEQRRGALTRYQRKTVL